MKRILLAIVLGLFLVSPALGIQTMTASSGSDYTLPAATSSTLGGVKPDGTSIINASGAISVTPASIGAVPTSSYPAEANGSIIFGASGAWSALALSANVQTFIQASNWAAMKVAAGWLSAGDAVALGPITLPAGVANANSDCTASVTPHAWCTGSGTGTAPSAPLYMQSGPLLTSPVAGSWGFLSGVLYFSPSTTFYKVVLSGTMTNAKWCNSDGTLLNCNSNAPVTTESDPVVGAINGIVKANGSGTIAVAGAADIPAVAQASGASVTLSAPAEIYECTGTCTVTAPVPPATGSAYQFCVQNDNNIATVITIAMPVNVMIENQARTSYGTAGTGHGLTSGGAVKDAICFHSKDATHYNIDNAQGTFTAY